MLSNAAQLFGRAALLFTTYQNGCRDFVRSLIITKLLPRIGE